MNRDDPFTPSEPWYECVDCAGRAAEGEQVEACPTCGGGVLNVAVPRE
jgi:hypothetical protein